MKYVCSTPIIKNDNDLKSLYQEIKREYSIYSKPISGNEVISCDKNSNVLKEWISLSSFLRKNITPGLKMISLNYPIRIHKNESPDFIISMPKRDYRIEVTRSISQNMANLYAISKKLNKCIKTIKKAVLFNDDTILTDEELSLFLDDDIVLEAYFGWPEINPWVELLYHRIKSKAIKNFKMDILLIDDHHTITEVSSSDTLEMAIKALLRKLNNSPIMVKNIGQIIVDNPIGLLKLRYASNWTYTLKTKPYLSLE